MDSLNEMLWGKKKKQYFSKYKKRWVDMKSTDNEAELRKYKYKIR